MIAFKLEETGQRELDWQIAKQVRSAIATGALNPGEPLPHIEELAKQLHIDSDQVRRAYLQLERTRYLESQSLGSTECLWFVHKKGTASRAGKLLRRGLVQLSGSHWAQQTLAKTVDFCHDLMGIGSGGFVPQSGEAAVVQTLAKRLPPPYTILDAGAYRGWFVKLILEHARTDRFEIHCFEPCESTFRILERNTGNDRRVRLVQAALGCRCEKAPLYSDGPGSGRSSLTRLNLRHCAIEMHRAEEVEVQTVDSYCQERGIERVHLLKIDVEGHELDVLAGAQNLLGRGSIDMVSFELGRCAVDTRTFFKDLYYLFEAAGMDLCRITPSGYLAPIPAYHERHEQFLTTNFLAIKKEA
jgi:FkbM family methyltransferase